MYWFEGTNTIHTKNEWRPPPLFSKEVLCTTKVLSIKRAILSFRVTFLQQLRVPWLQDNQEYLQTFLMLQKRLFNTLSRKVTTKISWDLLTAHLDLFFL